MLASKQKARECVFISVNTRTCSLVIALLPGHLVVSHFAATTTQARAVESHAK